MRREPEYFHEAELDLVYIAKRLGEALKLEELLTAAGIDYAVETDEYLGGVVFQNVRVGAFFYVMETSSEPARQILLANGYRPQ
jgi:hypothetical protein